MRVDIRKAIYTTAEGVVKEASYFDCIGLDNDRVAIGRTETEALQNFIDAKWHDDHFVDSVYEDFRV